MEKNPKHGVPLAQGLYKVRIKNSDNNKGKSAGYRVITYSVIENEIFLVDIYSKSQMENLAEEVIDFMRGFLSGAFKDNIYFVKGIITGCLRVAKESIFTGMNNLTVASILTRLFDNYFGK